MDRENGSQARDILPVPRTKAETRRAYDTLSRIYDYTLGLVRHNYAEMALQRLSITEGETVLEIGFGTGDCLKQITKLVGPAGRACGIDISRGMIERTKRRLEKAGLAGEVELCCGDATCMPFNENAFDAVFMSFTLEVFDTPDMPKLLAEIKKVLKPDGRLGIVDTSKEDGKALFVRGYEWLHKKCPKYLGSRPIYAEQCLVDAGYRIRSTEKVKIFRVPTDIIVATKAMP